MIYNIRNTIKNLFSKQSSNANNIYLFKEHRDISCSENRSILDATLAAGVNHMHICGGIAKCTTCRVSILEGLEYCNSRNSAELKMAEKLNFPEEIRLACQTKITGNITIRRMVADQLDMDIISDQFSGKSKFALGVQQKLTIVFTDIVNSTAIAEKFPSYDVVHILTRYYHIMNEVIMDHHGIISDVAGDGILAVFGKDETNENSVLDAVNAIHEMNEKLKIFNNYLLENYKIQFKIRAGIHYGIVIIGPVDTGDMKKTAVIGDNVNYASRIETANKQFGTNLLLSEEAYNEVKEIYPSQNIYESKLAGKSGTYKLFEIN